jgi:hypothetical protein
MDAMIPCLKPRARFHFLIVTMQKYLNSTHTFFVCTYIRVCIGVCVCVCVCMWVRVCMCSPICTYGCRIYVCIKEIGTHIK